MLHVREAWCIRQIHIIQKYMRIYVIQLQSTTVRSLLVLRLWWKTIRSRGIECYFHCFVFSQSGNSQLISAKKIRQANFIHWQNTGKYQFNKALLRFPTQGRTIWVCTFRSVCLYNVTKTSTKNALSWFLRLFLAWSRPGFGDSWNVQLTTQKSTSTFRHPEGIVVQTSSMEAQVLREQK